jgi:oligopeptide/dipeptide ABC transporter ATP-binding protein
VTTPLLSARALSVGFESDGHGSAVTPVLESVSFDIARGRTLALVGESGCGKSVTAFALMGLLPPQARVSGDGVDFEGRDLLTLPPDDLAALRGDRLAMIFQEPMSALNPVFTVGWQIVEALRLHRDLDASAARDAAEAALAAVGIPDPAARLSDYPHQLSGGMRQRVMIAMAIACEPDLLIADEPTTALDVTIQAQIVDLLLELQGRLDSAMLFISHDFGVVSHVADDVAVMYAGRIVEQGSAAAVIEDARHPYTRALLATTPRIDTLVETLPAIPGRVPAPEERTGGCGFAPRCTLVTDRCRAERPVLRPAGADDHRVACHEVHDD